MKTICAWCGKTIAVTCDHCGDPLLDATPEQRKSPTDTAMVCANGPTIVYYSQAAIDKMATTHGLCAECATLPQDERDRIARAAREKRNALPNAAAPDVTKPKPKSKKPREKRGPTGVPAATTHPREESGK